MVFHYSFNLHFQVTEHLFIDYLGMIFCVVTIQLILDAYGWSIYLHITDVYYRLIHIIFKRIIGIILLFFPMRSDCLPFI